MTPELHSEGPIIGQRPIVVVGAGAAGLMAALFAARKGARVILIERTRAGGKKILISGGGRCNILPSASRPERFVTDSSPNSLRKILRGWPLDDQRAFFERELNMRLVLEPETGKLFPETNRARDVRDGLVRSVRQAGGQLMFDTKVTDVRMCANGWTVRCDGASEIDAAAVILAAGGLSVPNTGSDGFGLRIAQQLEHTVHSTYPALTPLTNDSGVHAHLAGISLRVTVRSATRPTLTTEGGFLFTHRGYSGPAVLDVSHLVTRPFEEDAAPPKLGIQWTPLNRDEWETALGSGRRTVGNLLAQSMPFRLVQQLLKEAGISSEAPARLLDGQSKRRLLTLLTEYELPWTGNEGYKKAEVTGGGVALAEVHPGTMESRRHPGLFMCGEMLDAFGPIGGHNFQWAWATGRAAGLGAAAHAKPGD